jgi:hypothetical protein
MSRRFLRRWAAITFLACLLVCSISAQNSGDHPQPRKPSLVQPRPNQAPETPMPVSVQFWRRPRSNPRTARRSLEASWAWVRTSLSWLSILLNFGGVAAVVYVLLKSKLPQAFRDRTVAIQKGIKEAQAASADAARRLGDIESRLSKLGSEVAEIRASAEREAAAEEERIRQSAEEDKQKWCRLPRPRLPPSRATRGAS